MDIVLEAFDTYIFDRLYAYIAPGALNASSTSDWVYRPASQYLAFPPSAWAYRAAWPRDHIFRQAISLFIITWIFGVCAYFIMASLSYQFIFDKSTFNHPKFLVNQVRQEIHLALRALPVMALLTTPLFLLEVRGYSRLYDLPSEGPGPWYSWAQLILFVTFTDLCIYVIHRALHHPLLYRHLHKPHHRWITPSPFASHAFHPVDGFLQSCPYHLFAFIFPMQKCIYVALFLFVNIWTILIHDGEYIANSSVVNGAACHTIHHLYFNYNFGQFTTLWDRIGGSYRRPNSELFHRESKIAPTEWQRQVREMEKVVAQVEGTDDRCYKDDKSSATGKSSTIA